jgi:NACHT domain
MAFSSEQETELQEIAASCRNVLAVIEKTLERYSAIEASRGGFKTVWKRLKWEPEDIRDLRNRLRSNVGLLTAINGRIARDGVFQPPEYRRSEQDKKCLDWLSATTYAIQQSDFIARRQPGTGEWLVESGLFRTWIERPQETLFCPGIPGAGKTILASVVIDELKARFGNDRDVGVAYLFCSFEHFNDQVQKPESLLASILRQLVQDLVPMPDSVVALYNRHKTKGTRPSFIETSNALRSVIAHLSRVFIVIDGLDECDPLTTSPILDEFFDIQTTSKLNLLATSRYTPEITARFQNRPTQEIRAAKPDVIAYLSANLKKLPEFVSRKQQLQQAIVNQITDTVDGM